MAGPRLRVLNFCLVLLPVLFAGRATGAELRHRLSDTADQVRITTRDGFREITLPGTVVKAEPGRPLIPVHQLEFVLPAGQRVRSVRLEGGRLVDLGSIAPLRTADPWTTSEGEVIPIPAASRAVEGTWPESAAELTADGFFHGYRIVTVEVRPLRVEADGSVSLLEEAEVRIELEPDDRDHEVVRRQRDLPGWRRDVDARLRNLVANPGDIDGAGGPEPVAGPAEYLAEPGVAPSLESSPVRHLIVTTDAFRDEFQRLADHRTATGLPSMVVTMEEVFANARRGIDDAETLREYVRDAYSWWGVDYLLLGADTELIPTRYARSTFYPSGGFTDVPTDHYFACLDGNWNADGDALLGEHFANASDIGDFADLNPELAVGRAPVKTLQEAASFVDKVLQYEMPATTDWQTRLLFAAEVLFPKDWTSPADPITSDGAQITESLLDSAFTPCADPSVIWDRHYQNYTAYPGATEETETSVLDALDTGNYGVFHHVGHGFYFTMSVGTGQIDAAEVDVLDNGPNWFLLYSLNCSSSAYDFNCLNERFITNPAGGAVAALGSSRAAFATSASEFQKDFYRAWLCDGFDRVGDAFEASRLRMLPNTQFNSLERWTQLVYCLLGDPATLLWSKTPYDTAIFEPPTATLGDESLSLTVIAGSGPPLPQEGVTVTARKGLEDYAVGTTDAGGVVTLDFAAETTGDIEVWVSGRNVLPEQLLVPVIDASAPLVAVLASALADDGSAGSSGNGNGSAEAGEVVALTPLFTNGGSVAEAAGGLATLRSDDPWVTVLDSTVTIPAIAGMGQAWAQEAFLLSVDPAAPDEHSTVFELLIDPVTGPDRGDAIAFGLSAPEAEIVSLVIDDSAGNANGQADVGEEVDLIFTLRNYGTGAAEGLTASLSLVGGVGAVLDGAASWPDLPATLDSADNAADVFRVRMDQAPQLNTLEFTLTDAAGRVHVRQFDLAPPAPVEGLFLAEGDPERLRIGWTPSPAADLMGYLVYRKGPGDPDYVLDSPDVLVTGSVFESTDLAPLANYEFQVVALDSAGLASGPSLPFATATFPPEISCFPLNIGLETSGSLAMGFVDHDFRQEMVIGSDYVYVVDGACAEMVDGDGDPQTIGPLNGLSGQYQPAGIALGDLVKSRPGMEIVAHDQDTRQLFVLDHEGAPMPGWPRTLANWAWCTPVVGDVDGDGDLEVVINDISGYTYAFHHDGTEVADGDGNPGTYGVIAPRRSQDVGGTIYTEFFGRTTPSLFDVDGDGADEILFGSKYQNINAPEYFYALNADGSGTNAPGWPKQFVPRSEFLSSPAVADLDNDGIFEIVAISENDSLYVWDETGNVRPGFPIRRIQDSVQQNSVTPSPAIADFDADGQLEIVFVSVDKVASKDWRSRIEIIDNDGLPWPGWPVEVGDLSESSPVVGDLDGDGSPDIVYGIGGVDADDAIFAFDKAGNSLAGFPIPVDGFVRATPMIGDLDGDGSVNLMSASWDSQIHVWDLLVPYEAADVPWPTFRGNVNRTGVYGQVVITAAPEARSAARARLEAPRPNPFNPATELRFEIGPGTARVDLTIYDARGRAVKTLVSGEFEAGIHPARWDGLDGSGRPVASGIYFARLRVDGRDAGARKLALVK